MAAEEVWIDLDGMKVGVLKDWRTNPLTTVQRITLGASLNANNVGLPVFDTDLKVPFYWDGTGWNNGTVINNSVITSIKLGETIGSGFLVYIDQATGKAFKYNQNDTSLYDVSVGFTNQAGILNDNVQLILAGECTQMGGLVTGKLYYADNNGGITTIPPTLDIFQPVGIAKNPTTLFVNIQKPYIKIP